MLRRSSNVKRMTPLMHEALCSARATAWCVSELNRSMRFDPLSMNKVRYSRWAFVR